MTENIHCESEILTFGTYMEKYQPGLLTDLNPITQRPPIFIHVENKKSISIIESAMKGISLGLITIVKNEEGATFVFESLDGGHRKRALHQYYNGEFPVNGKYFNDLSKEDKTKFMNIKIVLDIYDPMSSRMKGEIFRILNGTMNPPNHQEILNSFGDEEIANFIRETVREEFDVFHKLFEMTDAKKSKWIDVQNSRLKLEEFVARIYCRYYDNGFLGSRKDTDLMKMYCDEQINAKSLKKKVDTHLDFLFKLVKERKKLTTKMGWQELNTLSNLYHYFNEKLGNWTCYDYETFYKNFSKVFYDYSKDLDQKWGDVVDFEFESADVTIKECFKNYTTCHDSYEKQEQLMKWIVEHEDMKLNMSVRILDSKRLFDRETKEAALAYQNYTCGIDGLPLTYDDAQAAHDVAYILGGSTQDAKNCVMVRKEYNLKMGTMTIAQYKEHLELMK